MDGKRMWILVVDGWLNSRVLLIRVYKASNTRFSQRGPLVLQLDVAPGETEYQHNEPSCFLTAKPRTPHHVLVV